jgi:hypothetical protein
MRKNTKELLIAVVILAIVTLVYAVLIRSSTKTGVLYMIGDEQPVCTGILSTYYHSYGPRESNFVCTDGRKFNNLTNFYLKEE